MKKIFLLGILLTVVCLLQFQACKVDPSANGVAPDTSGNISFSVPAGWPAAFYSFQNNTLTQSGFELGRKLFYDTRLSRDNSISCGSCHQQFAAFGNLDHPVSHGINSLLGKRNAPTLFNMAWQTSFFWDGGVNNIESQPINPIQNPVEMDETMPEIFTKISNDAVYKDMFTKAFGTSEINSQRFFRALAQFMIPMVSNNSKYDKYVRGEAGGQLTAQELNGLTLFRAKCATCHKEPLFTDYSFRNNGLQPTAVNDSGRAHITRDANDLYKFRVPSLRNVALSGPYMHDGRFNTLQAVLDHYVSGIYHSATLDTALTNGIALLSSDEQDLISFLNTLSDHQFATDKRFAESQ